MKNQIALVCLKIQDFIAQEEGQDLIEYALVGAIVALGAVAGMTSLASKINNAFNTVGNNLAGNI